MSNEKSLSSQIVIFAQLFPLKFLSSSSIRTPPMKFARVKAWFNSEPCLHVAVRFVASASYLEFRGNSVCGSRRFLCWRDRQTVAWIGRPSCSSRSPSDASKPSTSRPTGSWACQLGLSPRKCASTRFRLRTANNHDVRRKKQKIEGYPFVAVLSPNYARQPCLMSFGCTSVTLRAGRCLTEFKISRRHRTRTCLTGLRTASCSEDVPQKRTPLPETGLAGHTRVQRTFVGSWVRP